MYDVKLYLELQKNVVNQRLAAVQVDCLWQSRRGLLTPLPPHSMFNWVSHPGLVKLVPAPAASMLLPPTTSCQFGAVRQGKTASSSGTAPVMRVAP